MAHLVKSETKSSDKNRWATRWDCYRRACSLYGRLFRLDVCAEPETVKCADFMVSADWFDSHRGHRMIGDQIRGIDSLQCDWWDDFWCNPPFDLKREFILKARRESGMGRSGMMLLPYEPCTKWFRELVMPHATAVYVPNGRYNFLEPDGVTAKSGVNFPSCFVLWTPHHNGGEARIIHVDK